MATPAAEGGGGGEIHNYFYNLENYVAKFYKAFVKNFIKNVMKIFVKLLRDLFVKMLRGLGVGVAADGKFVLRLLVINGNMSTYLRRIVL